MVFDGQWVVGWKEIVGLFGRYGFLIVGKDDVYIVVCVDVDCIDGLGDVGMFFVVVVVFGDVRNQVVVFEGVVFDVYEQLIWMVCVVDWKIEDW